MQATDFFIFNTEEKTKVCGICKEKKSVLCFGKDGGANYLRYECKECARNNSKIISNLKKITAKPTNDHVCPICLRPDQQWCLDHDHKTNSFRGWLCQKCNRGLGNFDDDLGRMNRAIKYLEENNERSR